MVRTEEKAIDEPQDGRGQDWFTVEGAAEYLGISRPTVFRWMKDGTLSFYKVGNSTRFSREGLDAVVQKTTGQAEAEAAAGKCTSCGHGLLVEGNVQGNGRLYFKPDKTRFWTLHESLVPMRARVCTACGFVQFHADVKKLDKVRPGGKQEDAVKP